MYMSALDKNGMHMCFGMFSLFENLNSFISIICVFDSQSEICVCSVEMFSSFPASAGRQQWVPRWGVETWRDL